MNVQVFISFASDAEEEYKLIKGIIEEVTKNYFSEDRYIFDPKCWKDAIPGMGNPQNDKIDPMIIDGDCRLVIVLLKNRLGTVREDGKTGIEHEYDFAKKLNKEIMVYRCDFPIRPSQIDPKQLEKVNKFILQTKSEGLIVDNIPSVENLTKIFREKFARWAKKLINNERDLSQEPLEENFEGYNRGF